MNKNYNGLGNTLLRQDGLGNTVLRQDGLRQEILHEQIRSLTRRLAELNKVVNEFKLLPNDNFNRSLQRKMDECTKEIENTEQLLSKMTEEYLE